MKPILRYKSFWLIICLVSSIVVSRGNSLPTKFTSNIDTEIVARDSPKDHKRRPTFGFTIGHQRNTLDIKLEVLPFNGTLPKIKTNNFFYGLSMNIKPITRFDVLISAYYHEMTASHYFDNSFTDLSYRYSFDFSALEIPITLRYRLLKSALSPFVEGSILGGIPLADNYTKYTLVSDEITRADQLSLQQSSIVGFQLGAGCAFHLGTKEMALALRYGATERLQGANRDTITYRWQLGLEFRL